MYHSTHIQFVLYRHPSNGDLLLYQFPQSKSVVVVSVVDVQFITIWWCSAWWGLCSDFLIRQEMKPRAATYYLSLYFVCAFYLTNIIIISRTLCNDHNMFIRTWIYACLHNMYYIWIDYVSREEEEERETFLSQTPTEQQVAARIRTHLLIYRPQVYFYTSQSSIQHTPTVNWWYTIILFVEASKYTLSSTLHVLVQRA